MAFEAIKEHVMSVNTMETLANVIMRDIVKSVNDRDIAYCRPEVLIVERAYRLGTKLVELALDRLGRIEPGLAGNTQEVRPCIQRERPEGVALLDQFVEKE